MKSQLKVLCIHGVGEHEKPAPTWRLPWEAAVNQEIRALNPTCSITYDDLIYQHLFSAEPLSAEDYA